VPVARDSDRSFQPVSREGVGPCKHSAKTKSVWHCACVGRLFLYYGPEKPQGQVGAFRGLGKAGGEEVGKGGVSNRPPYEECSTKRGYSSMINPWVSQNGRMHRHRCGDADSATSRLTSTDLLMEGHGDPRRIDDDLRASLCLVAPWFFVGFGSLGGSPRN